MELLGESYATSSVSSIRVPVASGYKFYLMLFYGSALGRIEITTIDSAIRQNIGGYWMYTGSAWDSNSSSPSTSASDGSRQCSFVDFRNASYNGYVMWTIFPVGNSYSFHAFCSAGGYERSYIGQIRQTRTFGLNVCTPESFAISGSAGYRLDSGSGVTVYGIK